MAIRKRILSLIVLSVLTLGLVAGGDCDIGGGDDVDVFKSLISE